MIEEQLHRKEEKRNSLFTLIFVSRTHALLKFLKFLKFDPVNNFFKIPRFRALEDFWSFAIMAFCQSIMAFCQSIMAFCQSIMAFCQSFLVYYGYIDI